MTHSFFTEIITKKRQTSVCLFLTLDLFFCGFFLHLVRKRCTLCSFDTILYYFHRKKKLPLSDETVSAPNIVAHRCNLIHPKQQHHKPIQFIFLALRIQYIYLFVIKFFFFISFVLLLHTAAENIGFQNQIQRSEAKKKLRTHGYNDKGGTQMKKNNNNELLLVIPHTTIMIIRLHFFVHWKCHHHHYGYSDTMRNVCVCVLFAMISCNWQCMISLEMLFTASSYHHG